MIQQSTERNIHYTSSQVWKEKASAIRTLKSRALEYCSNEALLAEELTYLLEVFISNGYPEKSVWRMLTRTVKPKEEFDLSKSLYVPYHPRAKRLFKMLKDDFGFAVVCKKNTNTG